jgi:hypothetical protein
MINKELSNKIYYSTFVLAVLVIAIHSSFVGYLDPATSGYSFSLIFQRIILTIADSAVPTFFVISGYLLFSKFTLKDYPRMLLKKVFSLVIPYFIWSIMGFLSVRVFYPLIRHEAIEMTFQSASLDILLANCCPQIWFVRPLLVFFICSPILYFIFKYLKKWSIFIPIAIFVIYIFFRPNYFGIVYWIPLFFVGCYLSIFSIPIFNRYHPQIVSIIAIAILVTMAGLLGGFNIAEEHTLYFVYRHISVVFIWLAIDIIYPLFEKEKVSEVFKISAFLFFSHRFITFSVSYLLELGIVKNTNYNCVLLFSLTWVISSIICVLLGYVLKRFANPVYRVLAGRK